jgi:anti-sigma B factor antagonist
MFEVFQPLKIFSAASGQDLLSFVDRCLELGTTTIVVNFENVTFMDSAGLGALVTALKRLRLKNGVLGLCSLNGQARMLLDLTNMNNVFQIYSDLAEAGQVLGTKVNG